MSGIHYHPFKGGYTVKKLKAVIYLGLVVGFIGGIGLVLTTPEPADAHTTEIAWRVEPNGDVTFFAGTYHRNSRRGGIIINGVTYNFTGLAYNLPGDVDGEVSWYNWSPSGLDWQTVTVSGLSTGTYSLTTTRTSAVEAPWGRNLLSAYIEVVDPNTPPNVDDAAPSIAEVWPPNNKMVDISIEGVTDADGDDITITITGITNNESGTDDADGVDTNTAQVRADRDGSGTGRVYEIAFVASDGQAKTEGTVEVTVPHDQGNGKKKGRGKLAAVEATSWGAIKNAIQE